MITTRIGKRQLLRSCVLAFAVVAVAPPARGAPPATAERLPRQLDDGRTVAPAGLRLVAGLHLEYDARALDAPGSLLAESGTPTQPLRAPAIAAGSAAGAPAPTPWFKRWWVWAIVGVVAIGGGAAVYASTRGGGDGLTTYMTPTRQ